MYQKAMWSGFVEFKVVKKEITGTDIAAFTVQPVDSNAVNLNEITLTPGQYITVKTDPEDSDHIALRHYSLCSTETESGIQFAVRRDNRNAHRGLVSNHCTTMLKLATLFYCQHRQARFSHYNKT